MLKKESSGLGALIRSIDISLEEKTNKKNKKQDQDIT